MEGLCPFWVRTGRTEHSILLFLKGAWEQRLAARRNDEASLREAIRESAALRVRPKAMAVAVILAGQFPIMWGSGTSS